MEGAHQPVPPGEMRRAIMVPATHPAGEQPLRISLGPRFAQPHKQIDAVVAIAGELFAEMLYCHACESRRTLALAGVGHGFGAGFS